MLRRRDYLQRLRERLREGAAARIRCTGDRFRGLKGVGRVAFGSPAWALAALLLEDEPLMPILAARAFDKLPEFERREVLEAVGVEVAGNRSPTSYGHVRSPEKLLQAMVSNGFLRCKAPAQGDSAP